METLIVHPENKEQLEALKAFMKALKINFKKEKTKTDKTDFSEIAGKLEWNGNALKEQKSLRAEWD